MKKGEKVLLKSASIIILVAVFALAFFGCGERVPFSDTNEENPTEEIQQDKPKVELSLSVMSYNIRTFTTTSNQSVEGDSWIYRKEALFKHINAYSPDVLGVQELTVLQAIDFDYYLIGYSHVGILRENAFTGEGTYIYYKTDKFDLIETATFWLSETPEVESIGWDADCLRICTYARLKDKTTGIEFMHFNTHLDHIGAQAQREGAKLILSRMQEFEGNKILTGDLNIREGNSVYLEIAEELCDTKYIADETMSGGSYHAYKDRDLTEVMPIDYCFVSNTDKIHVNSYQILREKVDGIFCSDHYPVFVNLKIKE